MKKCIKKLLIANRGEIACRIIRTAKKMGIHCIAIYSDADAFALHIEMADEAHLVGPSPSIQSYLNIPKIIEVAKMSGADAIHPGYGFLSENPEFAEECVTNDIIFVGPPASAIRAMGSKSAAKRIMENSGVPLIPGYHGEDQSNERLVIEAEKIGFPIIVKPALGGGGKGMVVVSEPKQLKDAIASCRRGALASFNNDTLLLERYIEKPRHVEVQVFFDQYGNGVHLYDRDCSIQRRHQKIIEEAPAPNIPDQIRTNMAKDALKAAHAINYVGAGTVEFLYNSTGEYFFMEMNTRLQVEHPVTEMVTGLDLVEWQLLVAEGNHLPKQQDEITLTGHAIEARICAEDCDRNFIPSTGPLKLCNSPAPNEHTRIDTGIKSNDNISVFYDPLISKIICSGYDRSNAIKNLDQGLKNYCIAGVETNIFYLLKIISNTAFEQACLSTHFLEEQIEKQADEENDFAYQAVAFSLTILKMHEQERRLKHESLNIPVNWRLGRNQDKRIAVSVNGSSLKVAISAQGNKFHLHTHDAIITTLASIHNSTLVLKGELNGQYHFTQWRDHIWIFHNGKAFQTQLESYKPIHSKNNDNEIHSSPMPGVVTHIYVEQGQRVDIGEPLFAVEAMKMEHIVYAKKSGNVKEILLKAGETVNGNINLIDIE